MKNIYLFAASLFATHALYAQPGSTTFTSSGIFTVPANVYEITIEVVGAGGNGGINGGGGGGGGGYARGKFAVTPGANLNVHIGIHGISSVFGTTNVSTLISATGGANGGDGGSGSTLGGAPGTGIGGQVNSTGGAGGNGTDGYFGGGGGGSAGTTGNGAMGGATPAYTGSCLHAGGNPGAGGGYPGATGGKGAGFNDNLCTVNNPATAAGSYGAGGGGGNGNGSSFTEGTDGICIISWCNIDVSTTVTGITITANDTAATSFQWIDCTVEMPIDGDTSASFTPLYDGDYAVIVTEGGCTDTSACVSITGVGINPYQHLEQIITVYPNPFTNTLKVSAGKNASFQLMNAVGQVVWSGKQIETVDFSFLPSNVYLLKVMDQNQTQVIRLVK